MTTTPRTYQRRYARSGTSPSTPMRDLDAPSPLVHQFTPRISREEYERQAKEYTNRQLNLLSDQIRRDPSLIKNSIHYGAEVTSVKRNDQILKVVFWSILTCLLFFALYTPLESPMNNPHLISLSVKALCPHYNDVGLRFWQSPFVLFGFLVLIVFLWIATMQLDNKQLQLDSSFSLQFSKIFVNSAFNFLFSLFIFSALWSFTYILVFGTIPSKELKWETCTTFVVDSLADISNFLPIKELVFGAISIPLKLQFWLFYGDNFAVFLAGALLVTIIRSFGKTVMSIGRPESPSLIVLICTISAALVLGYVVPAYDFDSVVSKGEHFLVLYCAILTLGAVWDVINTVKENKNFQAAEKTVAMEKEEDFEDE